MGNPLFDTLGNGAVQNPFADIIRQAQELKKTFKGNPRDEVQKLLNSGAMSQTEYNKYAQIARQIMDSTKI